MFTGSPETRRPKKPRGKRLPQIEPLKLTGSVEAKVEFTPHGTPVLRPHEGVERVNQQIWVFRGKDILDAIYVWENY